jgi:hypothetical protein
MTNVGEVGLPTKKELDPGIIRTEPHLITMNAGKPELTTYLL